MAGNPKPTARDAAKQAINPVAIATSRTSQNVAAGTVATGIAAVWINQHFSLGLSEEAIAILAGLLGTIASRGIAFLRDKSKTLRSGGAE